MQHQELHCTIKIFIVLDLNATKLFIHYNSISLCTQIFSYILISHPVLLLDLIAVELGRNEICTQQGL